MAAPAVASSASFAETVSGTSRTINKPSGTTSGDWLILAVSIDTTASIDTPSGFTLVYNDVDPASNMRLAVFKRKADGSEGATFTITTASEVACGIICRVTGGDSSEIVDTLSVWAGELNITRSAGVFPCLEAYSACSDGALVLQIASLDDGTGTFTATPPGHTLVDDVGANTSGTSLAIYYKQLASQGYVGANTWTYSDDAEQGISITLVLRASANTSFPSQPHIRSMSALHPPTLTAVNLIKPYGTVDGETLLLIQASESASVLSTTGFTSIQDTNNGAQIYYQMYYKIASGEGASYSVASASQTSVGSTLLRIGGAHTSSPIDTGSTVATGTSAAPTGSTMTPTVNNCLVIFSMACDDDEVTHNSGYPTGYSGAWAESIDENTDIGIMVSYVAQTTATATGAAAATIVASEEWVAAIAAIKPFVAAGAAISPGIMGLMNQFTAWHNGTNDPTMHKIDTGF